ncbi:MAG: ABC transporter permease [Oscillospiraceae bacterium]
MTTSTVIPALKRNKLARTLGPIVFWLVVWQCAAMMVDRELILPSPLSTLRTLFELAQERQFWISAGFSLLRIFCGFASGVVLGAGLAVLTAISRAADALISPVIRVVRATPVASFIILVLLWISRVMVPAFISMLMVIPIVWEALSTAIGETDGELLEMARAYDFGRLKTVKLVYIPSVLPSFTSACLTAQGLAWKSGVAAEVLCLPRSAVGTELYYSKVYLETPVLFAWTAVVVVLSFLLEKLCRLAIRRTVRQ